MWCDIKDTKYGDRLSKQLGSDNAKQFAMGIEQERFLKWFGSGKTIKTENGQVVPFINPIMQVINQAGKGFNILERFRFKNAEDVRNFFSTRYTPGINRWNSGEDTFFIAKDDNRFINVKLLDEIDRIYPGLIEKTANGELISTTKDYKASSIESNSAKPTWFFTINPKFNFDQLTMYSKEVGSENPKTQTDKRELKSLLDKLSLRFNIDYEFDTNLNALGAFDYNTSKVIINPNKATSETVFHEFLHPFVAILKKENTTLYVDLVRELETTKTGIETMEETRRNYKELSPSKQKEEALVSYLGKLSKAKFEQPQSPFNRFVKWIKNLFKKLNAINISQLSLNTKLDDIANMFVDEVFVADLSGASAGGNTLIQYQKKDTQLTYEQVFDRIRDKVAILNATVRKRKGGEQFRDDINALNEILKNADEITSMNRFIENSLTYVDSAYKRFEKLRDAVKNSDKLTQEEVSDNLYVLSEIQQLLNVYESLRDIQLLFIKEGRKYGEDDTMNKLAELIGKHDIIVTDFKPFAMTWITEWLYPYLEGTNKLLEAQGKKADILTKEQFRDQLDMALRDISAAGYWLGATINSEDPISAAVGLALKDVVYNNHVKDIAIKDELEGAYKTERGTKVFSTPSEEAEFNMTFLREADFYEKIGENPDGTDIMGFVKRLAFHQEYNQDQYEKDRIEFFKNLGPKPPRNKMKDYREWNKKVSQFYSQNTKLKSNTDAIIAEKKRTLSNRQFNKWISQNTIEIDEIHYSSGMKKSSHFQGRIYSMNPQKGTFRIYAGEFTQLNDKYKNPEFAKLTKNPYFASLYKNYKQANDRLGDYGLRYGLIPQVSKGRNLFTDLKWDKGLKQNALDLVKAPVRSLYAEYELDRTVQRQDGTEVKHIPIKFTQRLESEDVSVDLLSSVLQFSQMANNYEGLAEIEPNILILKTVLNGDLNLGIEGRTVAKTAGKGNQVINAITKKIVPKLSGQDMLNARLNEFIDDVVYGDEEFRDTVNILGREFSVNKMAKSVGLLTSISTMALNFTGGINNVLIGNYNNALEAVGGRFYGKRDFAWAHKEYWKNITGTIGDAVGAEKSLLGHLAEHYDVPQGEFKNEFGKNVSGGQVNKMLKTSSLFFIQQGGEHEIQVTGMLALMKATKVTDDKGNEISLYDAWEEKPDGTYGVKAGVQWTDAQDTAFRNRLHAITKSLNGVYNKFDKAVLQRRWYGKLALMFRKYMFTSFKSRYGKKYVDYELGTTQEGYWNLFAKKLYKDVKDYKFGVFQRMWTKDGYSEEEKNAINRTTFEIGVILAAMILAGVASAAGEDDDDSWLLDETALQLTRMSSDITQYINPADFLRVIRNPAASVNIIEKWLAWMGQLFHPFDEYERATGIAEKGDNKLYIKTLKIMPVVKQFVTLLTPEEQIKFYQLQGK